LAKRIGIFVCKGCDIGKCIDADALCTMGQKDEKVLHASSHQALCSVGVISLINKEIKDNELDSVIIAACSPRVKTEAFDFPENILAERVNLREQVSMIMEPNEEDIQMAAEDYLNMGIEKLKAINLPEPYVLEEVSENILVVGGGITGITAAIEGAKAGYQVHLVEKKESLGGYAAEVHRQIPNRPPYTSPVEPVVFEKIEVLKKHENIHLHLSSEIEEISGQPGDFSVKINKGKTTEIKAGAIVAGMGWKPYDATKLGKLGYGKSPQVVTSQEFEALVKSKAKIPGKVLFIQCAGSRDKDHLPYCSNVCCGTSLKQATYVRESNPDSSVFIIYKDIRTTGLYENFYRECQKDDQVFMTKGEVEAVETGEKEILVKVRDTLMGDDIGIRVDMVVLATGMTPAGTQDLNLTYRLGKGLPELKYEFSDSHFICFPYETRRTGVYAAGALRAPMDIPSSMEDAGGAMLKAIQCIEATKRGEAVHPRAGDKSYPSLYLDRCTDCKRCTEECPFGAYDENEKGTPIINPSRCRRCGICLGSCPERVISFNDYSINAISAMIKSVSMPDEFEEKPRILAFVCENDAYPAFDMAAQKGLKISPFVRVVPVRCLGSVNKVWVLDALSKGYDGILQIGCKPGDDYQCHFIHGSELTETRGENIQEALETMMLEPERIKTEFVEITDYHKIPGIINDYVEEIELIGMNPFKDM